MKPTVAIITPSTGRATLRRTIESVRAQTYPCTHYVFVDGERFHESAQAILQDYPEVQVCYLPMNTGGDERKLLNSAINAAAPFLVKEDLLCYLDDDNWFAEHHVAGLVESLTNNEADYAYALRYFVDEKGETVAKDNLESLGFWAIPHVVYEVEFMDDTQNLRRARLQGSPTAKAGLIDTNCYLLRTDLARELSVVWLRDGLKNDRNITRYLLDSKRVGVCSGKRSVFYFWEPSKSWPLPQELREEHHILTEAAYQSFVHGSMVAMNQEVQKLYADEQGLLPWEKERVVHKEQQDSTESN
ncbi:MAG: glycosyltransferase [Neisseria sp.]|nr:glycosyltransferase [Neisseria sp.]